MDDTRLYTIGELARRTRLSVKTIRFYSDTGVVPPTDRTATGYRLYDLEAVSRLELVRTLRELGAGLDEIKKLLSSKTTLHELASAQLALLDHQIRLLHTRRAVLRAVVRQKSTTEEVRLMTKIAQMSDDERNRLIDEFWDEMGEEFNLSPELTARMRSLKPDLPDTPTTAQVDAWVELAEMVQDPSFRHALGATRSTVREASTVWQERTRGGAAEAAKRPPDPEKAERLKVLFVGVEQAYEAGEDPASERGRALADAYTSEWVTLKRVADTPESRRKLADDLADQTRVTRYWVLLAVINGGDSGATGRTLSSLWLAEALRASAIDP